jgi:hypothetical protein
VIDDVQQGECADDARAQAMYAMKHVREGLNCARNITQLSPPASASAARGAYAACSPT